MSEVSYFLAGVFFHWLITRIRKDRITKEIIDVAEQFIQAERVAEHMKIFERFRK